MSRVCANCGGVFSEEENHLVCPHCGADVDATFVEPDPSDAFEDPRMDDDAYAEFLREEGLAGRTVRKRGGCVLLLIPPLLLALGAVLS